MSGKWGELIVIRGPRVTAATVSRLRGNTSGFYAQLRPKSDPYTVVFEPHNPIVKTLRPGRHDGRCFRIHGAKTIKEQAILIHEAPNVSWLTGCISPRPLGDYQQSYPNEPFTPPARTIDELIAFIGAERANFFVDDYF